MNGKTTAGDVEVAGLLAAWRAAERVTAAAREAASRTERADAALDTAEWAARAAQAAAAGATAAAERADQAAASARSAAQRATDARFPAPDDSDRQAPTLSVVEAEAAEAAARAAYHAAEDRLFAEQYVTTSAPAQAAESRRLVWRRRIAGRARHTGAAATVEGQSYLGSRRYK